MMRFTEWCSLICVLLLAACESAEPTIVWESDGSPTKEQIDLWDKPWKEWKEKSKLKRVSANLFPTATRVRVYKGELGLQVSDRGIATTHLYVPDASRFPEVPAKGGEYLTAAEIKVLRDSVFYTLPPPAIAGCCIPRHGFLFYDQAGQYLGSLKVCYQCGCAGISPQSPHDKELSWTEWDAAALQKIIEAHHLTLKPEPPKTAKPAKLKAKH